MNYHHPGCLYLMIATNNTRPKNFILIYNTSGYTFFWFRFEEKTLISAYSKELVYMINLFSFVYCTYFLLTLL